MISFVDRWVICSSAFCLSLVGFAIIWMLFTSSDESTSNSTVFTIFLWFLAGVLIFLDILTFLLIVTWH